MNQIEIDQYHNKRLIATRYYLLGCKFYKAIRAMEFAMKFHSGTRKDKQTPEFAHQLDLVQLLTSLQNNFLFKEETIATAFLHDVCED